MTGNAQRHVLRGEGGAGEAQGREAGLGDGKVSGLNCDTVTSVKRSCACSQQRFASIKSSLGDSWLMRIHNYTRAVTDPTRTAQNCRLCTAASPGGRDCVRNSARWAAKNLIRLCQQRSCRNQLKRTIQCKTCRTEMLGVNRREEAHEQERHSAEFK